MIRPLFLTFFALASCAINSVRAHSVWIEPVEDKLVIRFAEPDGKLEKSPGYLDSLSSPIAFVLLTNTPVSVEAPKKADHFLLVGASPGNIACAETSFTVRSGRKPNFYARWQPVGTAAASPLLTLDLVPTGKPGEVRAYFRGQPLGGIKATLRTPDEKDSEITADGEGFFRFQPKQSGQYLLTIAHHRESASSRLLTSYQRRGFRGIDLQASQTKHQREEPTLEETGGACDIASPTRCTIYKT